ncbi:hypothetical protein MRB53_020234 [Persea americana]|uniref:Uncharacterized protein n=1 Tax=Persea americana TaxID=3435 RepID=A0ACC2L1G2_PERAE|nr:hypothetical protein MRB53_020234 [Persea americana]
MQGGVIGVGGARESSNNGSMSTVSKAEVVEQHDYVGMTEVSSHPRETKRVESEEDGSKLELGLGLSLGVGAKVKPCAWRDYCRILSAKDLSSFVSSPPNTAAASTARVAVAGTKRAAESDTVPQELGTNMSSNQVVGWPPIRAYRLNSLVNQAKGSVEQNIDGRTSPKKIVMKTSNIDGNSNNDKIPEKGRHGHSKFVKVNMDGVPIGRKVDLNAHICYETLAQALEDMFHKPTSTNSASRPSGFEEHEVTRVARRHSKLLDGSSELALTYEDREGDWMLVGDVPWGMFLSSARRLRIMKTSEANGPAAPRFQEKSSRQRSKPI